MTIYDDIVLRSGEPHPLAGVPQEVLDAAKDAFTSIAVEEALPLDHDEAEAIAHAVLMAGVVAYRKLLPLKEAQNE